MSADEQAAWIELDALLRRSLTGLLNGLSVNADQAAELATHLADDVAARFKLTARS